MFSRSSRNLGETELRDLTEVGRKRTSERRLSILRRSADLGKLIKRMCPASSSDKMADPSKLATSSRSQRGTLSASQKNASQIRDSQEEEANGSLKSQAPGTTVRQQHKSSWGDQESDQENSINGDSDIEMSEDDNEEADPERQAHQKWKKEVAIDAMSAFERLPEQEEDDDTQEVVTEHTFNFKSQVRIRERKHLLDD
ncbi:hypothetical protein R1sor_014645 [Riccia sorocarpa]|uniref:Uncharacterized protein n=1 Tax=Riccia sorocarpa TaxID=122646 RepID=A0ABD3HBU7_9MARC